TSIMRGPGLFVLRGRRCSMDRRPVITDPRIPSFPRSAWECQLRRSAAPCLTRDYWPSSDTQAPVPSHPVRPQSGQDGIPTEDRGNESATRMPITYGDDWRGVAKELIAYRPARAVPDPRRGFGIVAVSVIVATKGPARNRARVAKEYGAWNVTV